MDPLVIWSGTIKSTNFGAVSIVEWVVSGKSAGNMKHNHRQAWPTRIGIKFLANMSAEKIVFPCEVFSKFYKRTKLFAKIKYSGAFSNLKCNFNYNYNIVLLHK